MGIREDQQMIQLLQNIQRQSREYYSQQLMESRRANATLLKIAKQLGGDYTPAVGAKFYFINEHGEEEVGKMNLKADFEGVKKFRVEFRDKKENLADVQTIDLTQLNPELGLLVAKMDRVAVGVYEGEMGISGKTGMSKLLINADGDLGEGVVAIPVESEEINILPADAVVGKIEFLSDEVPVPEPVPEEPAPVDPVPVEPEQPSLSTGKRMPLRAGASRK